MLGKTISHYRIVEKLGEGGMGVVYKAEDERLRRPVALKFLRTGGGDDRRLKGRFTKEAEAAAALDHPNITTIYEIGEADGQTFIAMAFVDGTTLAERIRERPLPLPEALRIAIEVAEGLQAAHERGVVHRDVKPGNIMLTARGGVKVMDFGLAHLAGQTRMTKTGTIMGTPAYMSPEQTRGESVDHRCDIWSLGVVLYEMVTGRAPFLGENDQSVTYAIINQEPEPPTALRTGLPTELDRIIRKALSKDRGERYQHADEMRVDLATLRRSQGASGQPVIQPPAGPGAVRPTFPWQIRRLIPWLLVAIVSAVAVWSFLSPQSAAPRPVSRWTIHVPEDLRLSQSRNVIALSPDGTKLAYLATERADFVRTTGFNKNRRRMYLHTLGDFRPRTVPGTEEAEWPFFSVDSRWIGFYSEGSLWRIPVRGGARAKVRDLPEGIRSPQWTTSGEILFLPGNPYAPSGVYRISIDGGEVRQVLAPEKEKGEITYLSARQLPAEVGILASVRTLDGVDFVVISPGNGRRRTLLHTTQGRQPIYSPTGHLVYTEAGSLMAAPFDLERRRLTGSPVPALADPNSRVGHFAVSDDGTLAYSPRTESPKATLVSVDRHGGIKPLVEERRAFWHGDLSPDGRRLAIVEQVGSERHIWVYDLVNGSRIRLTTGPFNRAPVWTPDGRRIVYQSELPGRERIVSKAADGTGEEQELWVTESRIWPQSISRDGCLILASIVGPDTAEDILILPEGGELRPFLSTQYREMAARISRDGDWVAYSSNESGEFEIYVQPFPDGGGRRLVSRGRGTHPRWSADGSELFYRDGPKLLSVAIETAPVLRAGKPELLFEGSFGEAFFPRPDGSFIMIQLHEETVPSRIHVVLNWFEELKRLVPPP